MNISVVNPVGDAINRLGPILFKPFEIRKWFVLGFCAWLAYLGEGGGGGGSGWTGPPPGGGGPSAPSVNWPLIIAIAAVILFVVLLITVLILWLRARGKFMFLDGVVYNRAAVVEPWKQFRKLGNSLFRFYIVIAIVAVLGIGIIVGGSLLIALPNIQSQQFGGPAIVAVVLGSVLMLAFIIVLILIDMATHDFIVPIMYQRSLTIQPAWGVFRRELLSGRGGVFTLYVLMKILLAIAIGAIAATVTLLTCCIAALPYIGTVILLPVYVFDRCY